MIHNHPSAAALTVHILGHVTDWEAREVIAEAAWDVADEDTGYRPTEPAALASLDNAIPEWSNR